MFTLQYLVIYVYADLPVYFVSGQSSMIILPAPAEILLLQQANQAKR
jgi:hypothetical protein